MIVQYEITASEWTPITSAGQSGACWLDEDDDGAAGKVDVRVVHSTGSVAAVLPTAGKRVRKPAGSGDVLPFDADSPADVYYARCKNEGDKATISVDAV